MLDLNNIEANFNKYKNILIEMFISHYGEQYRTLINERIGNTYFHLNSNPRVDYEYAIEYRDSIANFEDVESRYKEYNKTETKAYEKYSNKLINYMLKKLNIKTLKDESYDLFVKLLCDRNLNEGYIDSLSLNRLRNYEEYPESLKASIDHDRKKVYECSDVFNFDINLITPDLIDELNEYRLEVQKEYRDYIASKSKYAKALEHNLVKRYRIPLEHQYIKYLMFLTDKNSYNIQISNFDKYYNVLVVQVLALKKMKVNYIDLDLIHELIHVVEGNGLRDGNHFILDEIKVQKLAIKITTLLHEKGIFIYDDPNDYVNSTKDIHYEWLFPFADNFIDKYETLIYDCAINNDIKRLEEYFGSTYFVYEECLSNAYYEILRTKNANCAYYKFMDKAQDLIKDMEDNYNKRGIRHV